MRLRDVARVVCSFAIAGATVVVGVSCGGSSSTSGGGRDASLDGPSLNLNGDGGSLCTPATCASMGYTCGVNADGCGSTINCGVCEAGDVCGAAGFSLCGSPNPMTGDGGNICIAKTCADLPAGTCGPQADGCGGLTPTCAASDAALCPPGEICGGGGPGLCGVPSNDRGDAAVCTPLTCADYPAGTCGPQSDGCSGVTANCTVCASPTFCGGDPNMPGVCGGNNGMGDGGDAGPITCSPASCATLGAGTCGIQADGCGGTYGPCTTCVSPAFCGGGGRSLCGGDAGAPASGDGGPIGCTPKTCANYPSNSCGQQSDGCGGLTMNCGTCVSPAFCGGNAAAPGTCGGNDGRNPDGSIITTGCTPKTASSCGAANCGQLANGCGGTFSCGGTCQLPLLCGGGGTPNVCGTTVPCTGLCPAQYTCDGGSATLSGKVVAGTLAKYLPTGVTNGDPVPNVLVYIPNRTAAPYVDPFTTRASETQAQQCSTCGADVSGNPLVETKTAFDGTFTLSQVPVGTTIPIVIQLGRWRRVFTVTTTCGSNTVAVTGLPAGILRMPRTHAEGDIPLTALSTGSVDAMECVLLKMGVDSGEFVAYSAAATGRIQMYQGNGATASAGGATPAETALMGTTTANGTYNSYDQVILPCWGVDPTTNGSANAKSAAALANLVTYGNNGGHFFATHYSYAWLYANNPYSTTANFNVNHNTGINSMTGIVSQTVPPTTPVSNPGVFVEWLNYIQALSNFTAANAPPIPADVTIANARHDVNSVALQSVDWIDGTDPGDQSAMLLHYTFDTPVNQTAQCGHSIFSDFHVSNSATGVGTCQANTDCSSDSCVGHGGGCTRNNQCASNSCNRNGTCDGLCTAASFPTQSDIATYCNAVPMTAQEKILEYMIWDLASCVPPQPTTTCTAKTCASYPAGTCGPQSDGCGGLTPDCNPCPSGQACGACGTPGVCCAPDGGHCAAKTCADYPNACGQQSDGCGSLTADCTCTAPATCGGGGTAGICGVPSDGGTGCVALTCAAYPNTCGVQADGCGGLTPDCNPCPTGQTCGGCGTAGVCCTPPSTTCTPQPCPASQQCGFASDGCGGVATCGSCTPPQTCGGGGVANQCGGNNGCVPVSCAQQGVTCGPAGDGCGGLIMGGCGTCPTPEAGAVCTPKTCMQLGVECGPTGDGCGNLIPSCGTCASPATCGGGGHPGVCGSPTAQ